MSGCTCETYVVDYSDPERYHPENLDREDDPACPEHGIRRHCEHGNIETECTVGYNEA